MRFALAAEALHRCGVTLAVVGYFLVEENLRRKQTGRR